MWISLKPFIQKLYMCCGLLAWNVNVEGVYYVLGKISSFMLEWLQLSQFCCHHWPFILEHWVHLKSYMLSCCVTFWDAPSHSLMSRLLDGCWTGFLKMLTLWIMSYQWHLEDGHRAFFRYVAGQLNLLGSSFGCVILGHLGCQEFLQNLCTY